MQSSFSLEGEETFHKPTPCYNPKVLGCRQEVDWERVKFPQLAQVQLVENLTIGFRAPFRF